MLYLKYCLNYLKKSISVFSLWCSNRLLICIKIIREIIVIACLKIYLSYICDPHSFATKIRLLFTIYCIGKGLCAFALGGLNIEGLKINPEDHGKKRPNSEEIGGIRKILRLSGLPDLGLSENAVVNTELWVTKMIEDVNSLEDLKQRHNTVLLVKEQGQLPDARWSSNLPGGRILNLGHVTDKQILAVNGKSMSNLDIRQFEGHISSFFTNKERALISIQEANDQFSSGNPSEHPSLLRDSRSASEHADTVFSYRFINDKFNREIVEK